MYLLSCTAVYCILVSGINAVTVRNCGRHFLCDHLIYQNPKLECGLGNDAIANRIVGGNPSLPHAFPWLVYINKRGQLHCGGALINDRYVVTAGHCVKWYKLHEFTVNLGKHDRLSTGGVETKVSRFLVHKDFTSDRIHDTHDIALMRLKTSIKFTRHILPVCLPHPLSDYTGRLAIVAGWGRIAQSGRPSRYVRQALVKVMTESFCLNTSVGAHFSDTMLCAYGLDIDACQGDSGAPLMYERQASKTELIGIVSWGLGCATPGVPGVYTKLVDYLGWIAENTKDAVYCSIN